VLYLLLVEWLDGCAVQYLLLQVEWLDGCAVSVAGRMVA
jgi:hypothetical protein